MSEPPQRDSDDLRSGIGCAICLIVFGIVFGGWEPFVRGVVAIIQAIRGGGQ